MSECNIEGMEITPKYVDIIEAIVSDIKKEDWVLYPIKGIKEYTRDKEG